MKPLQISLHHTQLTKISKIVDYEEPRVIRRANILNCLHHGQRAPMISRLLNVSEQTVRNTAHTFLEFGLERALHDDHRSGRPIDIDDRERSRIIAMVCSNPPEGHYRWTLDLIVEESKDKGLIEKSSISRETVRVILQEHDLKPWREKMWCIEDMNTEYIERMEDVLEVYERAHNPKKPLVCIDEKTVPLISDVRERIPAAPGTISKVDYEYARNASVNVFCGVEPKAGRYFNKVTENRSGIEFAKFLQDISTAYAEAEKIVLVMDNLSTHTEKCLIKSLGKTEAKRLWERFEVHYTPKHASWLNQAEIAIGMYSRQSLGDGRVRSFSHLKGHTEAWNKRINKKATKIQWRFSRSKARKSLQYEPNPKKLI